MSNDRNPILVPKSSGGGKKCFKCGSGEWFGRNVGGVVTFTCKDCKSTWQGGLSQLPQDPTIPTSPERYEPTVRFVENKTAQGGVEELRRKPDMRPDFKKGAPIPEEE